MTEGHLISKVCQIFNFNHSLRTQKEIKMKKKTKVQIVQYQFTAGPLLNTPMQIGYMHTVTKSNNKVINFSRTLL